MNAIQDSFTRTGQYDNTFDEFGNLVIIDDDQKYLSVVLNEEVYEEQSVSAIYNLSIEEFKDTTTTPNKKVDSLESEKAALQKQIATLTSQLSSTNTSNKDTLISASRDVIVNLRIKAGEGSSPSDFNTTFPYLPLYSADTKKSDASEVTTQSVQSASAPTTQQSNVSSSQPSSTQNTQLGQKIQPGDVCPRQEELQIIPPLEYREPARKLPVSPPVVTVVPAHQAAVHSTVPTVVSVHQAAVHSTVPTVVPIHQAAVQSTVPTVVNSCVEKFYPYGKYNGVWESLGLPTSPLISMYGVYSTKVTESYSDESSDTLSYQVYIPENGEYTLKFSADNSGYMEIEGVRVIDLSSVTRTSAYNDQVQAYLSDHTKTQTLTSGWKTINLFYKNWGGPHSVAATIGYNGRLLWTSRMAYNARDYADCSGNQPTSPIAIAIPKAGCDNPVSTLVYSFSGQVYDTLTITLSGQSFKYNQQNRFLHLLKSSKFSNGGLERSNPDLTVKMKRGRGTVQISQQPSPSNGYTAIVNISEPSDVVGEFGLGDSYHSRLGSEYMFDSMTGKFRIGANNLSRLGSDMGVLAQRDDTHGSRGHIAGLSRVEQLWEMSGLDLSKFHRRTSENVFYALDGHRTVDVGLYEFELYQLKCQ